MQQTLMKTDKSEQVKTCSFCMLVMVSTIATYKHFTFS